MNHYKTLLFDADRTLFDFDSAETEAFGSVMTRRGIHYTNADYLRYRTINAALWERFGRGEITKEALQSERFAAFFKTIGREDDGSACNAEYVDALADCSQLLPGAEALCRRLSAHFDMYIVTNGVSRTQHKRFANSPIKPYFCDIFVSEDASAPKPMTAYFDYVFAKIGEERRAGSVIIGDSPESDIAGGIAAGIDTIWYNPDAIPPKETIKPTYTVGHYMQLERLLLQGEI